jgi:hypothetical protein
MKTQHVEISAASGQIYHWSFTVLFSNKRGGDLEKHSRDLKYFKGYLAAKRISRTTLYT